MSRIISKIKNIIKATDNTYNYNQNKETLKEVINYYNIGDDDKIISVLVDLYC